MLTTTQRAQFGAPCGDPRQRTEHDGADADADVESPG